VDARRCGARPSRGAGAGAAGHRLPPFRRGGAERRRVAAFRKGLSDAGFVEGRTVTIDYRWAGGQNERLAGLAAELIARKAAVITALSSTPAAVAAKKATDTVPIYFLIADPPVALGLVASLGRPGGNATGLLTLAVELVPKRIELLHQLVGKASTFALIVNPMHPSAREMAAAHRQGCAALGVQPQVLEAVSDAEIEAAYAALKPGTALLVGTDPTFFARRARFIALSAQHAVPTMFDSAEAGREGGLVTYGADILALWEHAGTNVARLLKGAKPADLPVEQATKFLFTVNMKTATTLGLDIPANLRLTADEVID
jgi:putative ABC transport system substrate-binding protein